MGSFTEQQPNAVVIRDLRVQFSIEKHLQAEPNSCSVTVTNLAAETRAEVQRKPLHVRLDVGYDGQLARLFTGDLRFGASKRESVEWITKLEIGDGERAYRHARVNRSFRGGVTKRNVIETLAGSMGMRVPKSLDDARELVDQLASGAALQGPSERELQRYLKPMGMSASIQDGQLQILRDGEATADQAIVVSQDTGLVGVPEIGAPTEKGKPPVLSFRMLLYPGLRPGGRVLMQSRSINGLFRVIRVVHQGDTHGSDWHSVVEATTL